MEWRASVDENIRAGLVEMLVLRLLCERDMYGYEIRRTLAERTNNAFVIREASLYSPLYRMASRGLITSHKEMAGEKRFRQYYHIEEKGKEYLAYGEEQMRLVFSGVLSLFDGSKSE